MVVSVLSTDSGLFGSLAGRVSGWFSGSGDQIEHEPLGLDQISILSTTNNNLF